MRGPWPGFDEPTRELIEGRTAASMCVVDVCAAAAAAAGEAEEWKVCIRGLVRLASDGWGVGR